MKILLAGINAKYIHTNLAIRYLKAYAHDYESVIQIQEYTINQQKDFILSEIYKQKPDVLCFSCYIWNIEFIKQLFVEFKKILPDTLVLLGGPEVSFDGKALMEKYPSIDMIIMGEGEEAFKDFLRYYVDHQVSIESIAGILYRKDGQVKQNSIKKPVDFSCVPFPYESMDDLNHHIIYYEASRGCPFNCQYCMSSNDKGVRFRNLEIVYHELQQFLDAKVKQIKFVDRTFNCNKKHAMAIWRYLITHDNGTTNFHCEIVADLVDDEAIQLLSQARPGLFQFEVGVQSTNSITLKLIKRKTNLEKLFDNVIKIKKLGSVHQHLDLIAGLPEEDYGSFRSSFNDVYAIRPDKLQLGFLKLLKGTGLRYHKKTYGLVHQDLAPYEILKTNHLSYEDLLRLKGIEEMLELYYNSQNFFYTMEYLVDFFDTPFHLYEALADYWENQGYHKVNHNRMKIYTILLEFSQQAIGKNNILLELLKYDMLLKEKPKNMPEWITTSKISNPIKAFYHRQENIQYYLPELVTYTPKQISRMAHIEVFNINILEWIKDKTYIQEQETPILFNYYHRDFNHHAKTFIIEL